MTNPGTDRTPQLALYSNPLDTRTETDRVTSITPDTGLRYETTRFLRGGDPPGGESNAKPPLFEASQGRALVPDALYPTACVQTEIAVKTTSRGPVTMETHVIGEENRYNRLAVLQLEDSRLIVLQLVDSRLVVLQVVQNCIGKDLECCYKVRFFRIIYTLTASSDI